MELGEMLLRSRSWGGKENMNETKKAGERQWVCGPTLHSSNRIHLEEAGRQMLLPAMMHEWLALFHPFSQAGKEKQDLNQNFSNGGETESTSGDSDNGCLTPICLPKM